MWLLVRSSNSSTPETPLLAAEETTDLTSGTNEYMSHYEPEVTVSIWVYLYRLCMFFFMSSFFCFFFCEIIHIFTLFIFITVYYSILRLTPHFIYPLYYNMYLMISNFCLLKWCCYVHFCTFFLACT